MFHLVKIREGSFHIKENNNMENKPDIIIFSIHICFLVKPKVWKQGSNVIQCNGCNEPTLLIQEPRDMECD